MGVLACLATSNLKRSPGMGVSVPGAYSSHSRKIRMSPDNSQAEGAILDSCCSTSAAHGTARTEAKRMGVLACLATSNLS